MRLMLNVPVGPAELSGCTSGEVKIMESGGGCRETEFPPRALKGLKLLKPIPAVKAQSHPARDSWGGLLTLKILVVCKSH